MTTRTPVFSQKQKISWNRVCLFIWGLSEQIARFLSKNEQMSDSLKRISNSLIRSKELAIHSFAHFWCATWAICSQSLISSEGCEWITHGRSFLVSDLSDSLTSLIFGERPEQFAHIAQRKWAIVSELLTSLTKKRGNERKLSICSFFNKFLKKIRYKTY